MPAIRYNDDVEVRGWEPALDGSVDVGIPALEFPSGFSFSPATLIKTPNMPPISFGRQAPTTRARAAVHPMTADFTVASYLGPSSPQQTYTSASSVYCQARGTPVPTSARNAAAAGRSGSRPRTSTERKIARKLAENANYVPRPKNSFILFRTDFVAQKTAAGTRSLAETKRRKGSESDEEEEEEMNQSLSKQASALWNKMTEAEKRPWAERAKLEKAAHEAKYPNYRYRPVRQTSARRSGLGPDIKDDPSPHWSYPRRPPSPQLTCSETSTLVASDTESREEDKTWSDASPAPLNSSTFDITLQMPAPVRMLSLPTASPSSSALANALRLPTPTPKESEAPDAGSALPTVPPVSSLTSSEAAPSCTTGSPPIPRSPSVPIFDKRMVGQFPKQTQSFATMGSGSFLTQGQNSAFSFAARPSSCPSTPQIPQFIRPGALNTPTVAMSPASSICGSEMPMLPTPEDTETDYFCGLGQYADSYGVQQAGPGSALSIAYQRTFMNDDSYEKQIDDETHLDTHLDTNMDIDMHALLNLSPIPEMSEMPAVANETTNVQKPFEVIAELWAQDQQRMDDTTFETQPMSELQTQTQTVPTTTDSPFVPISTPSPKNTSSPENEIGLDTYALAVSSGPGVGGNCFNSYCSTCSSGRSTCTDNGLNEDLFRLDLDMDPVLGLGIGGCTATTTAAAAAAAGPFPSQLPRPASTLGFSALGLSGGGDAVPPPPPPLTETDDGFGYDRERGLYGLGSGYGYGYGFGIGNAPGFGYGF